MLQYIQNDNRNVNKIAETNSQWKNQAQKRLAEIKEILWNKKKTT